MKDFNWDQFESEEEQPYNWEQHPIAQEASEPPGMLQQLGQATVEDLPGLGAMVGGTFGAPGGPGSAMLGAGIGGYAGQAIKHLIRPPAKTHQYVTEPIKQAALGASLEGAGNLAMKGLEKGFNRAAETPVWKAIRDKFGKKAEKLAENATGATRKQAESFAPGTGRYMLDEGIVRFGSHPKNIAKRAGEKLDTAGEEIGKALKSLDEQGVKIDRSTLAEAIDKRIEELAPYDSAITLRGQLKAFAEQLKELGGSRPISTVEKDKRGFQELIKNWIDPAVSKYNKELQNVYRKTVEKAATKADPGLANKFIKEKMNYKILSPIEENASKRALQLNQHPLGGFLDTSTAAASAAVGGGKAAAIAVPARKILAPRLSSSMAVSVNQIYKVMSAFPEYNSILRQALTRSPQAANTALAILRRKDPRLDEYLKSNPSGG